MGKFGEMRSTIFPVHTAAVIKLYFYDCPFASTLNPVFPFREKIVSMRSKISDQTDRDAAMLLSVLVLY